MQDYEKKLQKVAGESSTLNPDVATLSREFSDFKSFVWQSLAGIKKQLELLSLGLDRHETAMRRKVILIHGLPEKPNEKLQHTVHNLISDRLKLTDINIEALHVCHRLGASQSKIRPVLVRFHHMEHRQAVWDSKTYLKGSGFTISEFLTTTRHRVFTTARKHFGIRQCWSAEGKINIILPDKSRRKIESSSELQVLINCFPSGCTVTGDPEVHGGPSSPKNINTKSNLSASKKTRRRNQ